MTSPDQTSRTRSYRDGRLESEGFPVEDVSDHLGIAGLSSGSTSVTRTPRSWTHVAGELGLHALAVEDSRESRQRPKVDVYADHQLLSMYEVQLDEANLKLKLSELTVIITPAALATVRDHSFDIDSVVRRWDDSMDLAQHGTVFLLYALIDHVVDGHFEAERKPAGYGVDRITSGLGQYRLGDQPDYSGEPTQRQHQEDHQLGGDYRCAYGHYRVYGQNLPYPGYSETSGFVWSSVRIVGLSGSLCAALNHKGWL